MLFKSDIKLESYEIFNFRKFMKHFLNSPCEYANKYMSQYYYVIASQFSIDFVHRMTKIPYFSYMKLKLALYPH